MRLLTTGFFLTRLAVIAGCTLLLLSVPGTAQVIVEDDFDDNAAGWTFESLTTNFGIMGSDVVYGFDYSALGIPEAPNSKAGDTETSGVRLRTNLTGLTKDQASIAIENPGIVGPYTVEVDMWLNWADDPELIGTTIFGGVFVGDAMAGDIDPNNPIERGAGFITSSDGDCGNCSYILLKNRFEMDLFSGQYSVTSFDNEGPDNQPGYDESDANTNPANGDLIDLPAFFPSFSISDAVNGMQPNTRDQKAGSAGFQWVTVTAEVDPTAVGNGPNTSDLGTASFFITNNATNETIRIGTLDNSQPDILDDDMDGDECQSKGDDPASEDICVNLDNPLEGDVPVDLEGRVSLALIDFFQGGGADDNLAFALYDNLRIFKPAAGLAGDFNDDGTVDAADYTIWRDNLGAADETALNGNGDGLNGIDAADYLIWKNNFGATAGSGSAVPEPSTALLLLLALACKMGQHRGRE